MTITIKTLPPGVNLLNGEQRNLENPATFRIPSKRDRENLHVGDYAKVGLEFPGGGGERMWYIVREIKEGVYVGELNNDPVHTRHELYCGDCIEFKPANVLAIEESC